MQVEKFAIFWEISHLHLRNFSIVCIILSSAHIISVIYFSVSVPVVLTSAHPKNEQNRSATLGPRHLNPMNILRNVLSQEFPQGFFQHPSGFYFLIP